MLSASEVLKTNGFEYQGCETPWNEKALKTWNGVQIGSDWQVVKDLTGQDVIVQNRINGSVYVQPVNRIKQSCPLNWVCTLLTNKERFNETTKR